MKNLFPLALLLAATYAQAQTAPDWQAQSQLKQMEQNERDAARHQRWMDSTHAAQAKRRKEIEAYNRTHPIKKVAVKPAKK